MLEKAIQKTFESNELLFKGENLEKRLNKIFSSKILIKALSDCCKDDFCYELVMRKLSAVLIYYLYTKDNRVSYSLLYKIMTDVNHDNTFVSKELLFNGLKHSNPNASKLELVEIFKKNILYEGYAVHSINPFFKQYILANGLGKYQINESIKNLEDLENAIYKNKFIKRQTNATFYYTLPSANALHYACYSSPERVFGGPLKELNENTSFFDDISVNDMQPIIVGQSFKKYYKRIAFNNLKVASKTNSFVSQSKLIIKRKYKKLIKDFCSNFNYVLLIPFKDKNQILNTYHKSVDLTKDSQTIFEYLKNKPNGTGEDIECAKTFDDSYNLIKNITPKSIGMEDNTFMSNLCTNQVVNDFSNVLFVKMPIFYNLLQKHCKNKFKNGTKIITEISPYMNDAKHSIEIKK